MKVPKIIFALAVLLTVGMSSSCTNDSNAEDDQLYEQGIDKKEIKNEDT